MGDLKSELLKKHCQPCCAGMSALGAEVVAGLLAVLPGWASEKEEINKVYKFQNYHETMAFVNAVAWLSHREDHHPDLEVGYNRCKVGYSTHSVGGLSENDFICAAKVESLLE